MLFFQEVSPSNVKLNSYLLEKLERKSEESFKQFKECLKETGQGFLVTELLGDDTGE